MRAASPLLCLWPGLTRLWLRGDWRGLLQATLFAALVNFALIASFLRPELVGPAVKWSLWLLLAGFWMAATWRQSANWTLQIATEEQPPENETEEDLFQQARTEYLKRHWYEAETLLTNILEAKPDDVQANLLLCCLYRRSERLPEAERHLQELERIDDAGAWQWEIERERQLIADELSTDDLHAADALDAA